MAAFAGMSRGGGSGARHLTWIAGRPLATGRRTLPRCRGAAAAGWAAGRAGRTGQGGKGAAAAAQCPARCCAKRRRPGPRGLPRPIADVASAVAAAAAPREARRPMPDAQRAQARGLACRLNSPRTRANLRCKLGARAKTHAKLGPLIGAAGGEVGQWTSRQKFGAQNACARIGFLFCVGPTSANWALLGINVLYMFCWEGNMRGDPRTDVRGAAANRIRKTAQ